MRKFLSFTHACLRSNEKNILTLTLDEKERLGFSVQFDYLRHATWSCVRKLELLVIRENVGVDNGVRGGTTSGSTTALAGLQMQVVSNSTVSNLVFDSTRGLLNFTVSGPVGTSGFFDATVAKSLLSGQPVVLIDGVQTSATVSGDTNFWYVHVTYPHSQHHVTIGGSNTVPEFPSFLLFAALLTVLLVVVRRKRKTED